MSRWLLFLLFCLPLQAQDLLSHRWEERVVVVYSANLDDKNADEQLALFKSTQAELEDRAMVVYHITNEGYRFNFSPELESSDSEDEEFDFKVMLLGLDGGIKYESNAVEPAQVYYELIDRMPMRRSQMRKRIKNGG